MNKKSTEHPLQTNIFHERPDSNHRYVNHNHIHHSGKNILIAFALNFIFTIIEIIGGLLTNSISIISDAVHDCGDSLSLGLAWYFDRVAQKKPDYKYTFGYKRFALLGVFINTAVLLTGSIFVVIESIKRLYNPQEIHVKGMFWLAIAGIIVNGIAMLKMKYSKGLNERTVSLHLFEDVLGWAAVLVASIVMLFFDFPIIDPILSILISCYILYNVYKNIKSAFRIVLQGIPENISIENIKKIIEKIDGVIEVHDLHIWSLDSEYNIASMHIVTNNQDYLLQSGIKNQIKKELYTKEIQHVTVEFELPSEKCSKCY
ncbi:MAG TPA: cation diffusion facilitator family transporter [Bacteroidaceae bacterium]|nr:cation diffusion facilitator family transporter [Bacteroidaceae bacterium]